MSIMKQYDVVIIGAGAAGLAAAAVAVERGRRVAMFEMGNVPARKVMASGGGRCNITNSAVACNRYFGENPNFVRGAIARVKPDDILNWARAHKIKLVEKDAGRYFCANGAQDVVNALLRDAHGTDIFVKTTVTDINPHSGNFTVSTAHGDYLAQSVIIATGGVSFATLGVSDFGHKIAKKFGHKIIPVRPALCAIATNTFSPELAGISVNAQITVGKEKIKDSMLFTHFGIGGPAIYRATVRDQDNLIINIAPDVDVSECLRNAKTSDGRKTVAGILSGILPVRVAKWICPDTRHIADFRNDELAQIAGRINNIFISRKDIKLHNLASAEVVRGGVDTSQISSKTMESKLCPGLFFVGEVLDVAGDLGGFNLHWAWASGRVAGQNA